MLQALCDVQQNTQSLLMGIQAAEWLDHLIADKLHQATSLNDEAMQPVQIILMHAQDPLAMDAAEEITSISSRIKANAGPEYFLFSPGKSGGIRTRA